MPTPPTYQELYDLAKAEMVARNPSLTDFSEGSVLDAHAGAAAVLADRVVHYVIASFAATFFGSATDEDLETLAADRLGLTKQEASPSRGRVTWTPSTPGMAYTIPAGFEFSATVNGATVTVASTTAVGLGPTQTSVEIPCESTRAGRDQNVAEDEIDTLATSFPTDPGATVTNEERFTGGAAAETDAEFRERIAQYYLTLRQGTVEALRAGGRSVAGVRYVAVDESRVEEDATVYVYVGDPDARSNSALAAAVRDAFATQWRAAGVLVDVRGADREEIAVELVLTIDAGADKDEILAAVRAAIAAWADQLEPNQTLRLSRLAQVAHNAHPAIRSVLIVEPTADTSPTASQDAIRVNAEDVTATFVEEV